MYIREASNDTEWDAWFFAHNMEEFLQGWAWGEFQRAAGNKPVRLWVIEGDAEKGGEVAAQVQGFIHHLPFGLTYLYLPRVMALGTEIMQVLSVYAKEHGWISMRIEPVASLALPQACVATSHRQPRETLLLDLSQTEDALEQAMHSKTRYNIHLAERKGVTVTQKKDIKVFWRLNQETTARDAFHSHKEAYYEKMLALENVYQFTAWYDTKPIVSHICVRFGNRFTYLHGASSNSARQVMAPYLLQWEEIRFAKSLGCDVYDFWGIAPTAKEDAGKQTSCFHNVCWEVNHPWSGITRYKAGFGGAVQRYGDAVEIPIRPALHRIVRMAKKFL